MEEDPYVKQLHSLQKYVPFLQNMIANLKESKKVNNRDQLKKVEALLAMISDDKKRYKIETLKKCEEVILKFKAKVNFSNKRQGVQFIPGANPPNPVYGASSVDSPNYDAGDIMNALKLQQARAKLNNFQMTPKSPSPERQVLIKEPKRIPVEKVHTIRSPNDPFNSQFEEYLRPPEMYIERPDIYSSAAESLNNGSPSKKSVITIPACTIPDISKPPISIDDLEILKNVDDVPFTKTSDDKSEKLPSLQENKLHYSKPKPVPCSKPKSVVGEALKKSLEKRSSSVESSLSNDDSSSRSSIRSNDKKSESKSKDKSKDSSGGSQRKSDKNDSDGSRKDKSDSNSSKSKESSKDKDGKRRSSVGKSRDDKNKDGRKSEKKDVKDDTRNKDGESNSNEEKNKSKDENNKNKDDNNKSKDDNNKSKDDNNKNKDDTNKSKDDSKKSKDDSKKSKDDSMKIKVDNSKSKHEKSKTKDGDRSTKKDLSHKESRHSINDKDSAKTKTDKQVELKTSKKSEKSSKLVDNSENKDQNNQIAAEDKIQDSSIKTKESAANSGSKLSNKCPKDLTRNDVMDISKKVFAGIEKSREADKISSDKNVREFNIFEKHEIPISTETKGSKTTENANQNDNPSLEVGIADSNKPNDKTYQRLADKYVRKPKPKSLDIVDNHQQFQKIPFLCSPTNPVPNVEFREPDSSNWSIAEQGQRQPTFSPPPQQNPMDHSNNFLGSIQINNSILEPLMPLLGQADRYNSAPTRFGQAPDMLSPTFRDPAEPYPMNNGFGRPQNMNQQRYGIPNSVGMLDNRIVPPDNAYGNNQAPRGFNPFESFDSTSTNQYDLSQMTPVDFYPSNHNQQGSLGYGHSFQDPRTASNNRFCTQNPWETPRRYGGPDFEPNQRSFEERFARDSRFPRDDNSFNNVRDREYQAWEMKNNSQRPHFRDDPNRYSRNFRDNDRSFRDVDRNFRENKPSSRWEAPKNDLSARDPRLNRSNSFRNRNKSIDERPLPNLDETKKPNSEAKSKQDLPQEEKSKPQEEVPKVTKKAPEIKAAREETTPKNSKKVESPKKGKTKVMEKRSRLDDVYSRLDPNKKDRESFTSPLDSLYVGDKDTTTKGYGLQKFKIPKKTKAEEATTVTDDDDTEDIVIKPVKPKDNLTRYMSKRAIKRFEAIISSDEIEDILKDSEEICQKLPSKRKKNVIQSSDDEDSEEKAGETIEEDQNKKENDKKRVGSTKIDGKKEEDSKKEEIQRVCDKNIEIKKSNDNTEKDSKKSEEDNGSDYIPARITRASRRRTTVAIENSHVRDSSRSKSRSKSKKYEEDSDFEAVPLEVKPARRSLRSRSLSVREVEHSDKEEEEKEVEEKEKEQDVIRQSATGGSSKKTARNNPTNQIRKTSLRRKGAQKLEDNEETKISSHKTEEGCSKDDVTLEGLDSDRVDNQVEEKLDEESKEVENENDKILDLLRKVKDDPKKFEWIKKILHSDDISDISKFEDEDSKHSVKSSSEDKPQAVDVSLSTKDKGSEKSDNFTKISSDLDDGKKIVVKKRKSELDKLHEDIKEMCVGSDKFIANTKRNCTVQQNDLREENSSDAEKSQILDTPRTKASKLKVLIEKIDITKNLMNSFISESLGKSKLKKGQTESDLDDSISNASTSKENEDDNGDSRRSRAAAKKKSNAAGAAGLSKKKKSAKETLEESDDFDEKDEVQEPFVAPEIVVPSKDYYYDPMKKVKCKLCNYQAVNITNHYRNVHPNYEVLVSRLSPADSEAAVQEGVEKGYNNIVEQEEMDGIRRMKFKYKCRFCSKPFENCTVDMFYEHLTVHTGEYRYHCANCTFKTPNKKCLRSHLVQSHNLPLVIAQASSKPMRPLPPNFQYVFGYMCLECNFLQMQKHLVVEHFKIYHTNRNVKVVKINMSFLVDSESDNKESEALEPIEEKDEIEESSFEDTSKSIEGRPRRAGKRISLKVAKEMEAVRVALKEGREPEEINEVVVAVSPPKTRAAKIKASPKKSVADPPVKKTVRYKPGPKSKKNLLMVQDDDMKIVAAKSSTKIKDEAKEAEVAADSVPVPSKPVADMNIFMMASDDLLEENKNIDVDRMKKMEQINNTITQKVSRSSIAMRIQNKLGQTPESIQTNKDVIQNSDHSSNLPTASVKTAEATNDTPEVEKITETDLPTPTLQIEEVKIKEELISEEVNIKTEPVAPVSNEVESTESNKDEEKKYPKIMVRSVDAVNECLLKRPIPSLLTGFEKNSTPISSIINRLQDQLQSENYIVDENNPPPLSPLNEIRKNRNDSVAAAVKTVVPLKTEPTPTVTPTVVPQFVISNVCSLADTSIINQPQTPVPKVVSKPPSAEISAQISNTALPSVPPSTPDNEALSVKKVVAHEIPLDDTELSQPVKCQAAIDAILREGKAPLYICPNFFCSYAINARTIFEKHLTAHPNLGSMVRCFYCKFKTSVDHYVQHITIRHGASKFTCGYCFYRASCCDYVKVHHRFMHDGLKLKVVESNYVMSQQDRVHLQNLTMDIRNLIKPFVCGISGCGKNIMTVNEYLKHLRVESQTHKRLQCGECQFKAIKPEVMVCHQERHKKYMYHCRYCVKGGFDPEQTFRHLALDHPMLVPQMIVREFKNTKMNPDSTTNEQINSLRKYPDDFRTSDHFMFMTKKEQKDQDFLLGSPVTSLDVSGSASDSSSPAISISTSDGSPSTPQPAVKGTGNLKTITLPVTPVVNNKSTTVVANKDLQLKESDTSKQLNESEHADTSVDVISIDDTNFSNDDSSDNCDVTSGKCSDLTGEDLFKCCFCLSCFKSSVQLRSHLNYCQKSVTEWRPFKCPHCQKLLKHLFTFIDHIRIHGTARFCCSLCSFRHSHQPTVKAHMKTKHKVLSLKITPMDQSKRDPDKDIFIMRPVAAKKAVDSSPTSLKVAVVQEDSKTAKFKTIYHPSECKELPIQSIYSYEVQCALCFYKNKVRMNMIKHFALHLENKFVSESAPVNPVPCLEKNEKMFDKMTNLAASSHLDSSKIGAKLEKKGDEQYPEEIPSNRRYVCGVEHCEYLTLEETMMTRHLTTLHGDEDNYKCKHCNTVICEKTLIIDDIIKHLRLHESNLYKCGFCDYLHYARNKIEKHCTEKHNEKPQVKVIREAVSETDAETTNKEVKLWRCGMCKFKCATQDEALLHVKNKHDVNFQYKCALCMFRTNSKLEFPQHFQSVHPDRNVDVIDVFYKVEESAAKPASDVAQFDTTPLWTRDQNRIKHIRGILLEESAKTPPKKTPVKPVPVQNTEEKIPDSPPPAKRPRVSSLDNMIKAIDSVASGDDSVTKIKKNLQLIEDLEGVTSTPTTSTQTEFKGINQIKSLSYSLKNSPKTPTPKPTISTPKSDEIKGQVTPTVVASTDSENLKDKKFDFEDSEVINLDDDDDDVILIEPKNEIIDLKNIESSEEILSPPLKTSDTFSDEELIRTYGEFGEPNGSSYRCPKCVDYYTSIGSDLTIHLYKDFGYSRYKCSECPFENPSTTNLLRHIKNAHTYGSIVEIPNPNHKLHAWVDAVRGHQSNIMDARLEEEERISASTKNKKPPKETSSSPSRKPAKERSSSPSRYLCDHCDFSCNERTNLTKHQKRHNPIKVQKCAYCSYVNTKRNLVVKHMSKAHPFSPVVVHVSDEGEVIPNRRKRKMNEKAAGSMGEVYICAYCPKESQAKNDMKPHIDECHPGQPINYTISHRNSDPKLKCMLCDTFGSKMILKLHFDKEHPGEKFFVGRYACKECRDIFETLDEIRAHFKEHHSENKHIKYYDALCETDEDLKKFMCPECESTFTSISATRKHVYLHTKMFRCNYCGETFAFQKLIQDHNHEKHQDKPGTFQVDLTLKKKYQEIINNIKQLNDAGLYEVKKKPNAKQAPDNVYTFNDESGDELLAIQKIEDEHVVPPKKPRLILPRKVMPSILKAKQTARKSTTTVKTVTKEGYSFYGLRPEEVDLTSLTTDVEVSGTSVNMSVEQFAKIFNLFPRVRLVDLNLGGDYS